MADITLIDPLGRAITLHGFTWFGHVLKYHPEMHRERTHAESAVRSPVAIHFSTSHANCRVYYGAGSRPGTMVAVVADVVAGYVKTAYRTDRTKGAVEWP